MKKAQWYIHRKNEQKFKEFRQILEQKGLNLSQFHNALIPTLIKAAEAYNPKVKATIIYQQVVQV